MEKPAIQQSASEFRYSCYSLGLLTIVYAVNFIDRQILAILNEEIKADLLLSDAQMGFLYGTVFAIFYVLFGIPFGALADTWVRRTLMAYACAFWSAATALSGLARNFLELALARVAVGVGEAGTGPCAYSLVSDLFVPARRATVLAILTSGVYLGAGFGLFIGGQIVQRWNDMFPSGDAPFDLAGWQVAFFVVGTPGLLLAIWIRTLREPERGRMDGIQDESKSKPFSEFRTELCAILPGLTLINLKMLGARSAVILTNLFVLVLLGAAAYVMTKRFGNPSQWVSLWIGYYAAFSWGQSLFLRDRPAAVLILGTRSWVLFVLGVAMLGFSFYGFSYFTAPFFIRYHQIPIGELGFSLGGITAAFGFLGVTISGVLADFWRKYNPRGRLYLLIIFALLQIPCGLLMLDATNTTYALFLNAVVVFCGSTWLGIGGATISDLVLPRMRGRSTAVYILTITLLGLALGPFAVGLISDVTGDLRIGLERVLTMNLVGVALIILAARSLEKDEATLLERAEAAGEFLERTHQAR